MRVTTKMLNDSMMKIGMPLEGGLIEQFKKKKNDDDGLLGALKNDKSGSGKTRYATQEKAVDDRYAQFVKYTANGKMAAYLAAGKYDFWG